MTAQNLDIVIEQGASFNLNITWQDTTGAIVDLTGYTAKMQIRSAYSSSAVILELSDTNGGIFLTQSSGLIQLLISDTDTSLLPAMVAIYDLKLSNNGTTRLLQGQARISPEVTI